MCSETPYGEKGSNLWRSRPLSDVTHSTRPIVEIPETFPNIRGLDSSKILVRSEYEETEKGALLALADNFHGFIVTGQPGIGPSLTFPILVRIS